MSDTRGTLAIPEGAARDRCRPPARGRSTPPWPSCATNAKPGSTRRSTSASRCCDQPMRDTLEQRPEWALAAAVAQGHRPRLPHMGEDWVTGPTRRSATCACSARRSRTSRPPAAPAAEHPDPPRRAGHRRRLPGRLDRPWPCPGWSGEVRIQPGVDRAQVEERMGRIYRAGRQGRGGGVATVLGAGNVASIPAMDVLNKLFAENRVCLLKMNPVNEYVGPYLAARVPGVRRRGRSCGSSTAARSRSAPYCTSARGRRRDPHHRLRQDPRRDRVRHRRGGRTPQGRRRADQHQARSPPSSATSAR